MIKQSNENFMMLSWLNKFISVHNGFICGGCFKNIFRHEQVRDIDIFFRNSTDYDNAVQHFDSNKDEFIHCYSSKNAEAYKHKNNDTVIELCHSIYGTPEQILNQFDFTIVKFAYFKEEIKSNTETNIEYQVLYHESFFEHLLLKRLVIDDKLLFPIHTFERTLKYSKYGFSPCYETKLKLLTAIHQLPDIQVKENFYDGFD